MRSMAVFSMPVIGLVVALFAGSAPSRAHAQSESAASKSEVEALKQEVDGIKATLRKLEKDMEQVQSLLSGLARARRSPDALVTVGVTGSPALGRADAPLTLVEFSDYQCPACRSYAEETWPALKAAYIDSGKVRYVLRHFPIDSIHANARKAAEAALCAGNQGKYWEMHDLLWRNQTALGVENLKKYAREDLRLDPAAFDDCLRSGRYQAEVEKDYRDGVAAGVRGTPSFFIGRTRSDGTLQGTPLRGALPIEAFRQAIERVLAEK